MTDFDLFIFDEFHIFAAPQVASVLNTMLLIRHIKGQKSFSFFRRLQIQIYPICDRYSIHDSTPRMRSPLVSLHCWWISGLVQKGQGGNSWIC